MDNNISLNQPAQHTTPPNPTIPSSPTSSNSWIKILLILIIVILIGAIGTILFQTYQANQQTEEIPIPKAPIKEVSPTTVMDETAGWKTWENNEFDFTFKYPPAWNVLVTINNISIQPVPEPGPDDLEHIWIEVKSNSQNLSLEEWIESNYLGFFNSKDDMKLEKISLKNALNGIRLDNIPSRYGQISVFVEKDGNIYILSVEPTGSIKKSDQHIKIFNQILSTFRFISSNPTPTVIIINDTYYCKDGSIVESSDKCSPIE